MTNSDRYRALIGLITTSLDEKESPAFLIKLYQEVAIAARAADLGNEPIVGSAKTWDDESKFWVRCVLALTGVEDYQAVRAWGAGRASLPWRKRIFTPLRPPKAWIESHVQFDRYRAALAIDEATEDLT